MIFLNAAKQPLVFHTNSSDGLLKLSDRIRPEQTLNPNRAKVFLFCEDGIHFIIIISIFYGFIPESFIETHFALMVFFISQYQHFYQFNHKPFSSFSQQGILLFGFFLLYCFPLSIFCKNLGIVQNPIHILHFAFCGFCFLSTRDCWQPNSYFFVLLIFLSIVSLLCIHFIDFMNLGIVRNPYQISCFFILAHCWLTLLVYPFLTLTRMLATVQNPIQIF